MTRSKQHIAICLTLEQLEYVRELVAHDRTIGEELDEECSWHADADSVLAALDQPVPMSVSEKTA